MALGAGARLGPYEIRDRLGAGGMGEVYRAWDARLGREVAVKVLLPTRETDPDHVRRFQQEARAAGGLSHPNLLSVYDVGTHDGVPYIVAEFLDGETLRDRLGRGALTARKAVEHAAQVARGLAAAHARGVVHRDLKPENVFVCRDGSVKVLDFGVAKLRDVAPRGPEAETASLLTRAGAIVGSAAYMSPEQVRGAPVDARSDIFSLGVVLYEMLAGRRPFGGETTAEIQAAILRDEPRDLVDARVVPALDRIVRRCLEKQPEDRFDTARDVALALEAVAGASGESPATVAPARGRPWKRVVLAAALLVVAGLGASAAWMLHPATVPSYTQLTFRRGLILSARFAPDGDTVVYSAAWDGEPARVFTTRAGSHESRDLGIEGVVLTVSPRGELAIKLGRFLENVGRGTLATVSLSGGAPRDRLSDVLNADWDPEGRDLAVVRVTDERPRLEYPIGRVLYEPAGLICSIRVLPDGRIALFEQMADGGPRPFVVSILDHHGTRSVVSPGWADPAAGRLAWSPSGELFFSASDFGLAALRAVTPGGRGRLLARVPGDLAFEDVDRRGRVLMVSGLPRGGVMALLAGATQERDLSWLDSSYAVDLSSDGRQVLLGDFGADYGGTGGIALATAGARDPVVLGRGCPLALSPNGRQVLALPSAALQGDCLLVVPAGAGEPRALRHPSIPRFSEGAWFPDGRHVAVVGGPVESRSRLFLWDVDNAAAPLPLSPEGRFGHPVVAPDGRTVAATRSGASLSLYAVGGGPTRSVPGATTEDEPLRWSADGRCLFVRRGSSTPAVVERVDVATGRRQPWKVLQPADRAGVSGISTILVSPDGGSYAYTFGSHIGTLFLAEGWR